MKIIILTAAMSGGGTERVISVLANYMAEKMHDVTILMTASAEVVYKIDKRVNVKSIGERTGGSINKRLERISVIRSYYKQNRDAIVISFGMETNLFAILAGIGQKNKVILSERNDPNQCNFKLLRNFLYKFANGFVFQTNEARNYFGKSIRKKSIVIANPINDNLPMPFEGVRKKEITTVGRLQPQKNHRLLLDSFAEFVQEYNDYTLIIYGKGELESELKNQAKKLKIDDKVVFAGFSENAMTQIIDSSMFVLSSDYEGISNSLMEAMAIGLPVISTDCPIGGSALLIENNISGILVPVMDKTALTNAMKLIAGNTDIARKMSGEAQKIREVYSSEKICSKWLGYINSFTAGENNEKIYYQG